MAPACSASSESSALSTRPEVASKLSPPGGAAAVSFSQAEAERRWPGQMAAWLNDTGAAPPGGESFAATSDRVLKALDSLLAEQAGATVLVVSHVTPMKILLLHALLAPPAALRRMQLDVACLCEIDWYAGGLGIVRTMNDTAHLSPPETAG